MYLITRSQNLTKVFRRLRHQTTDWTYRYRRQWNLTQIKRIAKSSHSNSVDDWIAHDHADRLQALFFDAVKMSTIPAQIDIRPMVARGEEPFATIMVAVDRLAAEQRLLLIAPFKPLPLLQVMERKGYDHRMEEVADGTWHVLFTPKSLQSSGNAAFPVDWPEPELSFDCAGLDPEEIRAIVAEALTGQGSSSHPILFMLVNQSPDELLTPFMGNKIEWFSRWDDREEIYAVLLRRRVPGSS